MFFENVVYYNLAWIFKGYILVDNFLRISMK